LLIGVSLVQTESRVKGRDEKKCDRLVLPHFREDPGAQSVGCGTP
jgi:hypothetical protein